jgi:hypothetical protein
MSAKVSVQNGPANTRVRSITRNPRSGWSITFSLAPSDECNRFAAAHHYEGKSLDDAREKKNASAGDGINMRKTRA